jgi:bifunctional non-homologous end joining protein LigD
MLATRATELPEGPAWIYEVKWDGYRALALKNGERVRLISRNAKDLTRDFAIVAAAVGTLTAARCVLDGEIVALDADGHPSFQALQHRTTRGTALVFYAFDLLELDGRSLQKEPLERRREELARVVRGSAILLSESLAGTIDEIARVVRDHALEGVVAKRRGSVYRPGQRTDDWIKVTFSPRQEFVVGGFKPAGASFDSLLVGYYDARGRLHFASKVRSGITPHSRADLQRRLRRQTRCPFVDLPNSEARTRWRTGVTEEEMTALAWVKPEVVVEISFVEWSLDGLLRHARFVGVREDKLARQVVRAIDS